MANYALIPNQNYEKEVNHAIQPSTGAATKSGVPPPSEIAPIGWTVDGLPMGHPLVISEWQSSLLSCLGNTDEFFSSDLEVCLLGAMAPCVLHGSNAERLVAGSGSSTFSSHCLPYAGLCMIGNCFFGWNCLAPWFSYHNRTAIRHKFNLEGNCAAVERLCGCCGSMAMDEVQQEQCEVACDFATHVLCHPCALCQEAREVRHRLPHPGLTIQPVLLMVPPGEQAMPSRLP